jgi:hypothetical protein
MYFLDIILTLNQSMITILDCKLFHTKLFLQHFTWCTKSNCGGTSTPLFPIILSEFSSGSCSTERSHIEIWSSAPDAPKTDSSVGCHSIDVIGAECHLKFATGEGFVSLLVG